MRRRHQVWLARGAVLAALAALVEIAPRAGWVGRLILVPFSTIILAFVDMLSDPTLWEDVEFTVMRVLSAFLGAALVGVPVGYVLWRLPRTYDLLSPFFGSYYAMPVFAFYPLLIAIFGLNSGPMILIGFCWAVIAVIDSTVTGLRGLPPTYHRVAAMYRMPMRRALLRIYLPGAAAPILSGLKLAISYSMIGVIASEFVLAANGLGKRVVLNFHSFELEAMYASILMLLLFAVVATTLLQLLESRLAAHQR